MTSILSRLLVRLPTDDKTDSVLVNAYKISIIKPQAMAANQDPDFSLRIRGKLPAQKLSYHVVQLRLRGL